MTDPIEFLENVASDAAGGQSNHLLSLVLRSYLSSPWGQGSLAFLRLKGQGLGRWLINSPAAEKLAVLVGVCYFLTVSWPMIAGEPAPMLSQLIIAAIVFPVMVYGIYLTGRDLVRRVTRKVREAV